MSGRKQSPLFIKGKNNRAAGKDKTTGKTLRQESDDSFDSYQTNIESSSNSPSHSLDESSDDDEPLMEKLRRPRLLSKSTQRSELITPPTSSTPIPRQPVTRKLFSKNSCEGPTTNTSGSWSTTSDIPTAPNMTSSQLTYSAPDVENSSGQFAPMAMFSPAHRLVMELANCEKETALALAHKEDQINHLTSQLDHEKRKSYRLGEDLHIARKKLKISENSLKTFNFDVEKLEKELTAGKDGVNKTLLQSQRAASEHLAELQRAKAAISEMEKRLKEANANSQKHAEALRKANETIEIQRAEIDAFDNLGDDAQAQLIALREIFVGKIAEFQEAAKAFQAIIDELEEQVVSLESQLTSHTSKEKQPMGIHQSGGVEEDWERLGPGSEFARK